VPPFLLFVFPALSQIQGKLTQIPGTETYQVSIVPSVNWAPPASTTSSAQISLRASTGMLSLSNIQSQTGNWELQGQYFAPGEAPDFDYFSFSLVDPLMDIEYVAGNEIPLFTFDNSSACTAVELVDNQTDAFASSNTLNVNAENLFSIVQAGFGQNAYAGNSAESAVLCAVLGVSASAANNPVPCYGDVTSITVQAQNGTPPYTVVYSNTTTGATDNAIISDFEGSVVFNGMIAGTYNITITDIDNSNGQNTIEVLQPLPITVELEPAPATCNGSGDGAVRVSSVFGAGGPDLNAYQYFWDIDPTNSNVEIDSLNEGTYSVTVVDANGCQEVANTTVGTWTFFSISEDIIDISCHGETDGIIDITPLGASAPYSYEWSPNANAGNVSNAWMLGPGEYQVTVTSSSGICTATETYTVTEPPAIEVDYQMTEPQCFGDQAFMDIMTVANAFEPYSIDIIGGYDQVGENSYVVEAGVPLRLLVEDAHGCKLSEDFLIPAKQEMRVDLGEDRQIKYGEEVYIDGDVFPLSGVHLDWSPADWLSCTDCPKPTARPLESTNYILRMTDDSGCTVEDNISIQVHKSRDLFVPNAFSPNHDGINDVFHPYGGPEVIAIKSMKVFNRWGGLVYNNNDGFDLENSKSGWNGMANGNNMDPGTYLYAMNVEFIDGEVVLFSGEVNLMK